MLRITLGGSGFIGFPADQESGYIKLVFPQGHDKRPLLRTYTIRQQRSDSIDVDFAIHEHKGPALTWAKNAQVGDKILVSGPGPKRDINLNADWFILCGDMTALPAISVNLASMPDNAKGYAIIEVLDEKDIQPLSHPDGIDLIWIIGSEHKTFETETYPLLERLKQSPSLSGDLSVWVACEFSSMKAIRQYLKSHYTLPKTHFYTSSYWKIGLDQDEHKIVKKADAER